MTWALIAPGPSATAEQAEMVRHLSVGVISSALPLAPWAQFVAASDAAWWRKYPEAMEIPERYAMAPVSKVTRIKSEFGSPCNSGVLGLEVLKIKGVNRVLLIGFDMQGTHFFGKYTNGLSNTPPMQRRKHLTQFQAWAKANPQIEVINCSPASALTCFPKARLEDAVSGDVQMEHPGLPGNVHCTTRPHPPKNGGKTLPRPAPVRVLHR